MTKTDKQPQQQAESVEMRIKVDALHEHPKALAFWPDSAQRRESVEGIHASVRLLGVRQPLTVCRRKEGGWWVIDGCTRLAAARAAGLAQVPCRTIEADEETIDDEIFVSNMERTRFGTGMRVMRYLERNMVEVLATAKINADPAARGRQGGRGKKAGNSEGSFSAAAITERLKVSSQDVAGGIELLRCKFGNKTIKKDGNKRTLVDATDGDREGIELAYSRVMDGMPLRRWLPAATGHAATNDKAKAETNWSEVAQRACTSLCNAAAHRDDMTREHWKKFMLRWMETAEKVNKVFASIGKES